MENRRTNAEWLTDLRAIGRSQNAALQDLHRDLFGGLVHAFPGQDSSNLEDAVQVSLIKILSNLDSFAGKSRFTTWAMSIAVRTALSDRRKKQWSNVSLEDIANNCQEARELAQEPGADPAKCTARNSLLSELSEVIELALTSKQRDAILAEVAGMPLEEIAARLGSNLNAVYKLLHDARKRLKTALEEKGILQEDISEAFSN